MAVALFERHLAKRKRWWPRWLGCSAMGGGSNEPTCVVGDTMGLHTVSSRELNQDVSRAKRAAEDGPVVITDRGRPSHVLLSWAEYRRLSGGPRNLASILAAPALSDIAFEPEKSGLKASDVDFN